MSEYPDVKAIAARWEADRAAFAAMRGHPLGTADPEARALIQMHDDIGVLLGALEAMRSAVQAAGDVIAELDRKQRVRDGLA